MINPSGNMSVEKQKFKTMKKKNLFATASLIILICVSLGQISAFLQARESRQAKGEERRSRLFLHVGPGKMGTTTIQDVIDKDRKTAEYAQDNFCPFLDTGSFLKFSNQLNKANFNLTQNLTDRLNVVGAELQECFDHGYDVFLSSEFFREH